MIATQLLVDAMVDALAADSATIAPAADACKAHLVTDDFEPGPDTDFADLTEATFAGSAAKSAGVGTQQVAIDPVTGQSFVQILEPAGGWTWECTAAPAAPGETITGVVLTNLAGTETYGSARLPENVTVSEVGHSVTVPWLRFTLALNPLS